ncbi:hypothetical protein BDW59DRAFT_180259 [Aspergillus cavernicola]|uniref:Actin-like ATPase domain-containing protein n=1 Tax=Aspergillus cavernicola TaxID=176166 RepID=A0ABR4IBY5_9EURO
MQGPSIVVGLDFGTTFSGVAWALEGSVDEVEVLNKWPGGGNRTSAKVPSTISYYDGEKVRWGYQIGPLTEACRGLKLLLDDGQRTAYPPAITSKSLLEKYGKDVVQVTADYLSQLIAEVGQVLQRRLGVPTKSMDLKFMLTVPAVWSDKAKDATLRAAVEAGAAAENVSLVSEPEAAALYTLHAIQPNSIATNDVIIVCDAGGGTVDLISYQIKTLDPLRIEEVTEGTGGICGSMLLDRIFEDFLRQKMGTKIYDALSRMSKEVAVTYWQDRVKPNFSGQYDDEFADVDYFIPVPGAKDDPAIPIEDGFFEMSSEDIEKIFKPIVQDVKDLIDAQVEGIGKLRLSPKAIILVGGFGSSEYLFHQLQTANPNVTVLQPPNGWSAVVSGAVHRGLEGNRVDSRIARRHYGISCATEYDPAIHNKGDRYWDHLDEQYRVDGRMVWYIKKSSKISENTPVRMAYFCKMQGNSPDDFIIRGRLYFCNDEEAPNYKNKRTLRLCELEADLRQIPQELFQKKTNSQGVEYFKFPITLTMTPTSASLLFQLEFNGVSYGSVRSKY